jgi:hypothetical protein
VTEDRRLEPVERVLRRTPPPADVPAHFDVVARRAALGAPVAVAPARRSRSAYAALGLAAAIAAGVGAVALVTGGEGEAVERTIALEGEAPKRDAWGRVEIEQADGPTRTYRIEVGDLPPAPGDRYYQLWFESEAGAVAGPAFDTQDSGEATVEGVAPANLRWEDCWISERRGDDDWVRVLRVRHSGN